MRSILEKFMRQIDNFSIRKKMIFIYIFCMLLPITLTDGVIIYTVLHTEAQLLRSEMEDIADAVSYQIFYDVDTVSKVAKSIYTSQYINDFLETKYEEPFDYVVHYQQFLRLMTGRMHSEGEYIFGQENGHCKILSQFCRKTI